MSRLPAVLISCLLAVAAAGCGGDTESSADAEATPEETPTAQQTPSGETATVEGVRIQPADDLETEPEVTVPGDAEPPEELVTEDLVTGDGPVIEAGDEASVQYTGYSWSTGEKFDASWDRGGQPFTFTVGGQQVIEGWDEGVAGMRVGGRRVLIIPPDMGYGPQGSPPAIGPDETLVFVVDAVGQN